MENKSEKSAVVLSSEYLSNEPWFTLRQDHIRLTNGVEIPKYYVLEYPDWVNVLAITKDKKFLMIRQYRHGTKSVNFELCGGCVDPTDASPLMAAQRELLEETGYGNGKWSFNLKLSANPSTTNNWTYNFIAEDVEPIGTQHLDGGEDISVHLLSLEEVINLVQQNEVIQSIHACAIWKYLAQKQLLPLAQKEKNDNQEIGLPPMGDSCGFAFVE